MPDQRKQAVQAKKGQRQIDPGSYSRLGDESTATRSQMKMLFRST
jgi:hypothetical protein